MTTHPPAQAASQFNQHEQETAMSKSYSLPTKPEGVIPSLIERFNSGKFSAMETLYEGAVLIADDGHTVTDSHGDRCRTRARSQPRPAAGGQGAPCVR